MGTQVLSTGAGDRLASDGARGIADGIERGIPTLPQLLVAWEQAAPSRVCLRRKELGRWREITASEWATQTRIVGAAFAELGVERGDRVGVLSENRPE